MAISGVILGAWYMLWLVQRVFFGPLREPAHDGAHHEVHDLNFREICALVPLAVFVFWIGLVPQHFLQPMAESLDPVAEEIAARIDEQDLHATRPLLARETTGAIERKEVARVD